MDEVFDLLRGLIPTAIAVIWIMRRFSRRRSGSADKQGRTQGEARKGIPADQQTTQRRGKNLKAILEQLTEMANAGESTADSQPFPGGREFEHFPDPPKPQGRKPEPKRSLLVGDDNEVSLPGDDAPPSPGSLERLSKLPPLAQGILWSTILDQPVGMKNPEDLPG